MNYKSKLFIGVIMFIALFALVYSKCRQNKRVNQVVGYTTAPAKPIERWDDKKGNQHAKVEIQQVPKEVFDHSNDSLIKEIRKITKANNLLQATIVKLSTKDSVFAPYTDTLVGNDTVNTDRSFAYIDPCVDIYGTTTDSGVAISYDTHPTITIASHWDNPGLFKPKQLYVEAITDKCSRVDTLHSLVIQKPPKAFVETRGFVFFLGLLLGAAATMIK